MKKVLSIVLALATVASMASVAFAADPLVTIDANAPVYETKDGLVVETALTDDAKISKGSSIYMPVKVVAGTKAADVKKFKVKAEWLVGEDLLEANPALVYKKTNATEGDAYKWFVEFTSVKAFDTSTADLLGNITVYKGSASKGTTAQLEFATFGAKSDYINSIAVGATVLNDKGPKVFKFKDGVRFTEQDETEIITFDGVGEIEGNYYEQGKLYLGFNTKFNADVADVYPEANLEFVNFPGNPKFNKSQELRIYDEEGDKFFYTLKDGELTEIKATYVEEDEWYAMTTRTLSAFVISDAELDVTVFNNMADEEVTAPTEAEKPNPDTGR